MALCAVCNAWASSGFGKVLDGYLVAFHFRGQRRGLYAEFFGAGRGEQLHGLLVFGGCLACFFPAAGQFVRGDSLNP
jgi:hypothetical protein